jgi:hypothetical protein
MDMKPILFTIGMMVAAVSVPKESFASSEQNAAPRNLTFPYRHHAVDNRRPAVPLGHEVSGVIPRALRGGNPLQMINPFAPSKYGSAEENVSFDPNIPGKGNGIDLLSISF